MSFARSVHAEANCIISASRTDMIGSSLFLACHDMTSGGTLCGEVEPCSMCKRLIINAGIKDVFIRTSANEYKVINVESWIENDPSLDGSGGY